MALTRELFFLFFSLVFRSILHCQFFAGSRLLLLIACCMLHVAKLVSLAPRLRRCRLRDARVPSQCVTGVYPSATMRTHDGADGRSSLFLSLCIS